MTYSEHELEFTFAKNDKNSFLTKNNTNYSPGKVINYFKPTSFGVTQKGTIEVSPPCWWNQYLTGLALWPMVYCEAM